VREIEVAETGSEVETLAPNEAIALRQSGAVSVDPIDGSSWLVSGVGKVGVVRVGDLVVRVTPKVDIAQIFFMLGYGRRFDWRDQLVPYYTSADLVHVLAEAFARQADRALGRGVLHGYVELDDELSVVRGRLRATELVTRRFGQLTPLLVRYDEFTPDVPENQIIRTAARVLRRLPGVSPTTARHLRVLDDRLDGVRLLTPGEHLPVWRSNRRNMHYDTALWFGEMVLRHRSLDLPTGPLEVNGFLINMATVFEDFVTATFSEALTAIGGRVQAQDPHTLDHNDQIDMKPDLVWYRNDKPAAVIDAKYKAEKPAGYPNADIYQMLAYCTALGLNEGHLIYAAGNEEPAVHHLKGSDVTVYAHALDLDRTPDQLILQVAHVAAAVVEHSKAKPAWVD
jgi:5-methylcytosine-specific restriction enzyme subunit McrC